MAMQTPLRRVTGLGAAGSGTGHFWLERMTGAAGIFLTILLGWLVYAYGGADRATLAAVLANPLVATGTILAVVTMVWHMKIGMQVIVEDYVHTEWARITLIALNTFFCIALAGAGTVAVILLALGA